MKILVVEDEFMVAMTLRMLIERQGHEVIGIADDVTSTVNTLDREKPQLAFVDIQLARGTSGLEAAAEMRKRGIICIFLTANPPDGPRPDLALGCLPKPFSERALAGTIAIAEAVIGGSPMPEPPLGLELYIE